MQNEENIVSYTLDEIRKKIAADGLGLTSTFYEMSDAEAEARAAADAEDPTNAPDFWKQSEQVYPPVARKRVNVEIDSELLQFVEQHHWNLSASVNDALREYTKNQGA